MNNSLSQFCDVKQKVEGTHCKLLIFKMLRTVIFLNLKELQYSLRMKKTIICLILINIPIQKKYIYLCIVSGISLLLCDVLFFRESWEVHAYLFYIYDFKWSF